MNGLRGRQAWRVLTEGEIAMASLLFGDAIDYARVRVYSRRYLPFGLQPRDCAMTPNGHLYFHRSRCLLDFSTGSEQARHWFMHEMTHVWQHQLGYPVRLRGALRLGLSYRYRLSNERSLSDYNMEAQGDLLADYFVLKHLNAPAAMHHQGGPDALGLFERVLAGFLANPSQRQHLPKRLLSL
jgi:hypothetical protein